MGKASYDTAGPLIVHNGGHKKVISFCWDVECQQMGLIAKLSLTLNLTYADHNSHWTG